VEAEHAIESLWGYADVSGEDLDQSALTEASSLRDVTDAR